MPQGFRDKALNRTFSGYYVAYWTPVWGRPQGRPPAWCAQYDLQSRGESPPWTVMTGTIRLGKGVRREAESEESRRRNRGFDVQEADFRPLQLGSPGQGRGSPIVIRKLWGRSDGSARRGQALPEEISALVRSHRTTAAVMPGDRGGEVSSGHSSLTGRGAQSLMQGADGSFR